MKIAFIGDIVGKHGRNILKKYLPKLKNEYFIDYIIANGENAAHGFGLTIKTANELFSFGIDLLTGGNHTWDNKEIDVLFETHPVIRPLNYPKGAIGSGVYVANINNIRCATINLMGYFTMPMVDNPYHAIFDEIKKLKEQNIKHIFVDFHAEATSEKNALLQMLKGEVSFIAGTHTHVGTDDLQIMNNTGYVSDVGLTGCFNEVIGMSAKEPIYRFTTGMKAGFQISKSAKSILQMIVFDIDENGKCQKCFKIKAYDNIPPFISQDGIVIETL